MNNAMTTSEKRGVTLALILGAIAFAVCWVYRDELDPDWAQRLEPAKWHMEEMDRRFR